MKSKNRKGGISTIIVWMIATVILSCTFYIYMQNNIITIKYENLSQFARDNMLILETNGEIEKSYLLDCKNKLTDKLNMKNGETLNIYLKVNDVEYNVSSTSTPNIIKTDYGDNISVRYEYKYQSKIISMKNGSFRLNMTNKMETMESSMQSISKNRNTSDG